MLERWFNRAWYGGLQWTWLLLPLMLIYRHIVLRRRKHYLAVRAKQLNVPVIVVGNITVGGTGKTPVICELARQLTAQGKRVGVLSRGYGAKAPFYPFPVKADSPVAEAGDEPLLIAQRGYNVVIDPVRSRGAQQLADMGVDVILCDDGMQHYALYRDIEICLLDGERQLGNRQLLPVGPLREPESRLKEVDFIWYNGRNGADCFYLQPAAFVNIKTRQRISVDAFKAGACVAVAGIGNPQRFFLTLQKMGIDVQCIALPDHYVFTEDDFAQYAGRKLIMTEKDAVKCSGFATEHMWYLEVQAEIPQHLLSLFFKRFGEVAHG